MLGWLSFGGVTSYTWFSTTWGIAAPNSGIVQRSTVSAINLGK